MSLLSRTRRASTHSAHFTPLRSYPLLDTLLEALSYQQLSHRAIVRLSAARGGGERVSRAFGGRRLAARARRERDFAGTRVAGRIRVCHSIRAPRGACAERSEVATRGRARRQPRFSTSPVDGRRRYNTRRRHKRQDEVSRRKEATRRPRTAATTALVSVPNETCSGTANI